MSIKSTVTVHEPVPKKPYYPRVMVNIREGHEGCKGVVVLFIDKTIGTIIECGEHSDSCPVGLCSDNWVACDNTSHWQPCTITLTTED